MAKLKIKPLGEKVLVEEVLKEESKGIVLPDDVESDKEVIQMEVIEVGSNLEDVKVKKGDHVLLRRSAGDKLVLNGNEYRIVKSKDLLATIS